ncbi:MAG: two-component regulator propeller domain-containing protein [Spirochaetota bacterium]
MRLHPRAVAAGVLLIVALTPLYAADESDFRPRFDRLGIEDGLSSSSVSGVIQDEEGFIWFATQSGLNRYDGYSFERYENDPFDSNSLSHNLIQTIFYDDDGSIWLGTYGGLNRYDPATGLFTLYENVPEQPDSLSNNVVVAIARDSAGNLWAGTLDGLNRLDEATGRFQRYLPDESDVGAIPDKVVRTLLLDDHGTLWVGTYGGLSRYLPAEDSFATIGTHDDARSTLPSPYVMSVIRDPGDPDLLRVATWGGGLSAVDTRTGRISTDTFEHDEFYTQLIDSEGKLWAGTWGHGLYVLDPGSGECDHVTVDRLESGRGLSHDVVYSLMEDESGVIWIGTNGGGVNKYVPWHNRFETIVHDPEDANSITSGKVNAISFDPDGTVWFGVYGGGLVRHDPAHGEYARYRHDRADPGSLTNDIVNTVLRDSAGNLWVGTNTGLNRYLPARDSFERYYAGEGPNDLPEDVIFAICETETGDLWFGTNTSGAFVMSPDGSTRRYSHDPDDPASLSDNLVRTIFEDSRGNVWVGTNQGLNRFDSEAGRFVRYLHDTDTPGTLSSDNIRSLHEDSAGRLWIATGGGGANRFHYETESFTVLSTADGLASNHVLGVVEDESGSLWFSTNRGISILDPGEGTFRTVNTSNGLLSNELTDPIAVDGEGRLYFGSVDGVTVIAPLEDTFTEYAPRMAITSAQVLGYPRALSRLSDGTYEPLALAHDENFFALEFSALDFASPEQNNYAYMLEGFDKSWVNTGNRNFASYTNLSPGNYLLRIRGAGSRGNWTDAAIVLPVIVEPPWWRSRLALGFYALLAVAILGAAVLEFRRRGSIAGAHIAEQERRNDELEQKVRERTAEIERSRVLAEQATREKSQFLANMSHEIRTPLNGMIGMLSLLARTPLEPEQREYLQYSRFSAENLNALVSDLLDFERIVAGELRLAREAFSLSETIAYIRHLFAEPAAKSGLTLEVSVELGGVADRVRGDRGRLVQVLTNLVSNAIKYTLEGGVTIRLKPAPAAAGRYHFEVADTGVGIAPEHLDVVFERFRQLEDGRTKRVRGVGLGLAIVKQVVAAMGGDVSVESEIGRGSRFVVGLPFAPALDEEDRPSAAAARIEGGRSADSSGARSAAGSRVLLCEDEAINRLYLTRHLESLGYEVEVTTDGSEAIERVSSEDFALVLMDLGMPRVGGLDATRRIRAWERSEAQRRVPIIALTAHTHEDDIQQCHDAGMDAFVSKPIKEPELHAVLEEWIR